MDHAFFVICRNAICIDEERRYIENLVYPATALRVLGLDMDPLVKKTVPVWIFNFSVGEHDDMDKNMDALSAFFDQQLQYNGLQDPSNPDRVFEFIVDEFEITDVLIQQLHFLTM